MKVPGSEKHPQFRSRVWLLAVLAGGFILCFWIWREYQYRRDPGTIIRIECRNMVMSNLWEMTIHGDGLAEIRFYDDNGKLVKKQLDASSKLPAIEHAIREYRPDLLPSRIGRLVPDGSVLEMTFETTSFRKTVEIRHTDFDSDDSTRRARHLFEVLEECRESLYPLGNNELPKQRSIRKTLL